MQTKFTFWLPDANGNPVNYETISNSIIFIGANGAGKSRLGAWIEQQKTNQVHRIGAQRNLNFADNIPLKSYREAEEIVLFGNAEHSMREMKIFKFGSPQDDNYVTYLFDDFNSVLSALIAKSNIQNMNFVQACKDAEKKGEKHPHTPKTDIDKLILIWKDIFPHRLLKYDDTKFYACDPQEENDITYSATKMSDGERTALYFIAQVLCVPQGKILLIDEPELHLHKSLMNRLWIALERCRSDCLFIYITHDTQFAALHVNAEKYWVRSYSGKGVWDIQKIETQDFPEDLLFDLLGNRKNVLFVEGMSGSCDIQLYSLVYKNYYIVPCGSCTQVIARTKAFNNTGILHHYKAYGLIDRDYRSDYEINAFKKDNIFTIEVAEVENLFITEELVKAMAKIHGKNENDIFQEIKKYIIKSRFEKEIDSQVCQAVVYEIKYRLSSLQIDKRSEANAITTLKNGVSGIDYELIKQDIENKFNTILRDEDYAQVIKVFNEKGLAQSIGHFIGIINKEYCQMVIGMINRGIIDIEKTLGSYLPGIESIPR